MAPERWPILLLAAAGACAEPGGRPEPSDAQSWVVEETWRLADAPLSIIGVREGPEEQTLYRIKNPQWVGPDLVAVRSHFKEIRLFRTDGTFVRNIGRQGEGPEEFRRLSNVYGLDGGLIMGLDGAPWRAVVFDTTGAFRSSTRFPSGFPSSDNIVVFGDGSAAGIRGARPERLKPAQQTWFRDTVPLVWVGVDGSADSIARLPGQPWLVKADGWFEAPMAPTPSIARWRDMVAVNLGDDPLVRIYRKDGAVERLLSGPHEPARVDGPIERAWLRERRAFLDLVGAPAAAPAWPNNWELMLPEALPTYRRLLSDDADCLWVQRYRTPGDTVITWEVVDVDGGRAALLDVPSGFTLTDVNDGRVMGVLMDEMNVQTIWIWEVVRGEQRDLCRAD